MKRLTAGERLLQELGITEPEEIDLETIAWHLGATVKYRILDGCEARIVGTGTRAIITVNSASAWVRQRFSLGHEIGHWHYHRGRTLVCSSEDIREHGNSGIFLERQADSFSADLLMPSYILDPYLRQFQSLNFDTIRQVAKAFNTSIPATAIRLTEHGTWPVILVCHRQDGRKWFVRNRFVSDDWFPSSELSIESHAFGILFGNEPDQKKACKISASTWFDRRDAGRYTIQEQSIRSMDNETLSILFFADSK